jgi:hypothetical protein
MLKKELGQAGAKIRCELLLLALSSIGLCSHTGGQVTLQYNVCSHTGGQVTVHYNVCSPHGGQVTVQYYVCSPPGGK